VIFCTLFNKAYLPQGLALYRSLERTAKSGFLLYVLCMDVVTAEVLKLFDFPHLRVIPLDAVEDDELRSLRKSRSVGEYCWTCTTPLLSYLLDRHSANEVITYVDADIRFFSDPAVMFDELGSSSIYVHEHDFAPEFSTLIDAAGRFNVGVVAFRNDAEGRRCVDRWKRQCLDECVMDPAANKCGDQNYLDEWPARYPSLVITSNPGVGLAPWNITKRHLSVREGKVTVDNKPAVFYHYHSLRLLRPYFGIKAALTASGAYSFQREVISSIYQPYVRDLWRAARDVERMGLSVKKQLDQVSDLYSRITDWQLLLSFGGIFMPREWNARVLRHCYRIGQP
jgi:hypothetical protein